MKRESNIEDFAEATPINGDDPQRSALMMVRNTTSLNTIENDENRRSRKNELLEHSRRIAAQSVL